MSKVPTVVNSLVKYDTPVLVSEAKKKQKPLESTPSKKGGKKLPPVENKPSITQAEDILNSILPPRQWEDGGRLWVQYVSSTPATRLDVIKLQKKLDQQLIERKAKETGICPVREELYSQCFDELIRQVTVLCAERGLLLLRVRDEMRVTINAYKTLYESSVAFGMRKALQAEQGKAEMIQKIKDLEKEKAHLQNTIKEWATKYENLEKKATDEKKQKQKEYEDEIQYLKKTLLQYKNELDRLMALPKK